MALLLPFTSFGQVASQSTYDAVVAAEDAFVAQIKQAGTAAAFVANSAPTALVADGGKLVNAQDYWRAQPSKPGTRLTWYPSLVDVAQSGELAYTTGPWTMLQNEKPQTAGEYVTVWRKQPEGGWKFVADMGIERIGTAPARAAFILQPHLFAAQATPSTAPANIVLDVDRKFATAEQLKPGETYGEFLSAEARLYRPGLSMMQGAAAAANMKTLDRPYEFKATTGYLAAAGDLGYVVGTLHRASAGAKNPEENGSYLRIWRREAAAGWRVVLEIFNLTPSANAAASPVPTPQSVSGAAGQAPVKRVE
ncbi:DUF4440 domain-containing protein [Hymenobacter ruricola]|uniref:DUF4440 domain-containing protein n=1 Tax=Hymenobacter ruricola TaxID=2791023 RepID=A0ABS0HYG9_9BACT|nr:DUF4440 domain-containing protein [Hymenobacter ruricola]MBF9219746.1 DUF4440 domain-containing protein [Hymenobacter ruricola]